MSRTTHGQRHDVPTRYLQHARDLRQDYQNFRANTDTCEAAWQKMRNKYKLCQQTLQRCIQVLERSESNPSLLRQLMQCTSADEMYALVRRPRSTCPRGHANTGGREVVTNSPIDLLGEIREIQQRTMQRTTEINATIKTLLDEKFALEKLLRSWGKTSEELGYGRTGRAK